MLFLMLTLSVHFPHSSFFNLKDKTDVTHKIVLIKKLDRHVFKCLLSNIFKQLQ